MDCDPESSPIYISITCPIKDLCVAGSFFDLYCPAFEGYTRVDGLAALRCRSSEMGYVIPCPRCGNHEKFVKSRTELQNWICRDCGFYSIPDYVDTIYIRQGYTLPVKCRCGHRTLVIPVPHSSISKQDWECPQCHQVSTIFEALDR